MKELIFKGLSIFRRFKITAEFFSGGTRARTVLPAVSALYALDGLAGVVTHVRGIRHRPGGFREPLYNLVMGPPLLAPGAFLLDLNFSAVASAVGLEGKTVNGMAFTLNGGRSGSDEVIRRVSVN